MADVQTNDAGSKLLDARITAETADNPARRLFEEHIIRELEGRMQLLDPTRGYEVR